MRRFVIALVLLGACEKEPPPAPERDPAQEARGIVLRHSRDVEPVLDLASARIGEFFSVRFGRVGDFIDDIFGFRGKWRAAFWGRDDYERWVRRAFERRVLRPEDFEREVLEKIVADFAHAWAAEEARVVEEARELVGAGAAAPSLESFAASAVELAPFVRADGAVNVVSIAGGEAAVMALGAALSAAGVCAAGSWWSLGIGLVAGAVVGIAVEAVAGDAWEDAARTCVHVELDRLRREVSDKVLRAIASAWLENISRQQETIERSLT